MRISQRSNSLLTRCKCCLENDQLMDMWTEYDHGENTEIYGDMLSECFLFTWLEPNDQEEKICKNCVERLREAISFRRDIIAAQEVLQQLLEEHNEDDSSGKESESYLIKVLDEDDLENMVNEGTNKKVENNEGDHFEDYLKEFTDEVDCKLEPDMLIEYLENDEEVQSAPDTRVREIVEDDFGGKNLEDADSNPDTVETKCERQRKKKSKNEKHYQNVRSILLCSNATPIKSHSAFGYACSFCPNHYADPRDLKKHTLGTHNYENKHFIKQKITYDFNVKLDVTDLKCALCDSRIEQLNDLMKHLKEIHFITIYTDIPNQIVPFRFNSESLKCAICEKEFDFFKLLNEHMNMHYENFVCNFCQKSFINLTTYRMHSYRHRGGEFKCNFCTKIFLTNARKTQHERLVHRLKSKPYKCAFCCQRFCDATAKNKHEHETHGVDKKVYKCQACDSTFSRQRSLKDHIQMFHLLNRPFHCNVCGKSFSKKRDFERHVNTHSGLKRYQCDACLKCYARSDYLRNHIAKKHEVE